MLTTITIGNVVAATGLMLNVAALIAIIGKWSRWSGVVDTKLADIVDHLHNLPCRQCKTAKE